MDASSSQDDRDSAAMIETNASSEAAASPATVTLPPPPRAAELVSVNEDHSKKLYWDRSHYQSPEDQIRAVAKSTTLYVGNLAFSTRSRHVRSHFCQLGPVERVVMGLDRNKKTPCGFCFVQYMDRRDALAAVALLSGTKLDGRVIRVELDAGFQPGRQYGRGKSGGQVRDERRTTDPARNSSNKRDRSSVTAPSPQDSSAAPNQSSGDGYYGPTGDNNGNVDQEDMGPSTKRQRTE